MGVYIKSVTAKEINDLFDEYDIWWIESDDVIDIEEAQPDMQSVTADRKTEPQTSPTISKMEQVKQRSCDTCKGRDIEGWRNPCIGCTEFAFYEPKDELQTADYCDVCNHKGCDNCTADGSNSHCVPSNYEPQIERNE